MRFESVDECVRATDVDLGVTGWVEVTQPDVADFGRVTRAMEWIHLDPKRAASDGPFGGTVAHGYLTLSLATWFLTEILSVDGLGVGVNYGLERVRFPAPVPVGSRVRARGVLRSAERVDGGVRTNCTLTVDCDRADRPVCVADVVSLILAGAAA